VLPSYGFMFLIVVVTVSEAKSDSIFTVSLTFEPQSKKQLKVLIFYDRMNKFGLYPHHQMTTGGHVKCRR